MTFTEIIQSKPLVLVDFFAEWCGPCKMMKPILEELKTEIGEEATIIKVDVDKSPGVSEVFSIQGVPTLILFKAGQPVWRQAGVVSARQLKDLIHSHSN
ncbi:MAG: thioredoxin [Bacteroidia bacterium]|jgi:thioredoxin 1